MLTVHDLTYSHPSKDILFSDIDLSLADRQKAALVGNNGTGKSTLLRLIAGQLEPRSGSIICSSEPYYVPQHFGQFDEMTVGEALRVDAKLDALAAILRGKASTENLTLLNDDWSIEDRCREALAHWKLDHITLDQRLHSMSGGEKTKLFLAGIEIHTPEIVLLDEPSNHLDQAARQQLYEIVERWTRSMLVVSHDRTLLDLLDTTYELGPSGVCVYGGNYEFYAAQKQIEREALQHEIRAKASELRRAREAERATLERKQRNDARGPKKQIKEGVPRIAMNTLRNNAERSTSRLETAHAEKLSSIYESLSELRDLVPDLDKMKLAFEASSTHKGKVLLEVCNVAHGYGDRELWAEPISFQLRSGERVALKGANGSGKTTLIDILLGRLEARAGEVKRAELRSAYVDQDYSILDDGLSVIEQANAFNVDRLEEHEVKIRLARFLFLSDTWSKPCSLLSGGERMRLILACLTINDKAPDLIILDEPTNNLDLQNVEILTAAIRSYQGTLLVVSHDERFLEEIRIERAIELTPQGARVYEV